MTARDRSRPASAPSPGDRRIPSGDGRLHLRIRGEGPPILCLHGLTAHGEVWEAVSRRLVDRNRLYVPDLLGRGRSDPRPDLSYRLAAELSRLSILAGEMPDRPYLAVGHSHGAALAVALAHRREILPPGPCGLVLVTPVTPWTERPPVLELLRIPAVRRLLAPLAVRLRIPVTRMVLERRAFGDPSRVRTSDVRRFAGPYSDPRRAEALLRILADWRPDELSAHVPGRPPPARVIAGGRDVRVPPAEARRWAHRLGADFRLAPRAGHMVPQERPDLVADAVRFVARRAKDRATGTW